MITGKFVQACLRLEIRGCLGRGGLIHPSLCLFFFFFFLLRQLKQDPPGTHSGGFLVSHHCWQVTEEGGQPPAQSQEARRAEGWAALLPAASPCWESCGWEPTSALSRPVVLQQPGAMGAGLLFALPHTFLPLCGSYIYTFCTASISSSLEVV